MSNIGNQVTAKFEELKGKGLKAAEVVKAKAVEVREKATHKAHEGQQKLNGLLAEMTPKDFLDKFGTVKFPELVEPGGCGWLVPAGSIDALVAAMRGGSRFSKLNRALSHRSKR